MSSVVEANPLERLRDAISGSSLILDENARDLHGQDVFSVGGRPAAIFRPQSVDELCTGVVAASKGGLTILPRGGGMSYTSGYIAEAGAVLVDVAGLNAIVQVDEVNATVTVEAGCTWAKLYRELHPRGLRVPMWGTLSGVKATVGGGMSQNGLFWGSRNGSIASMALSFDVVLADGTLLRTGSKVLRPFGPDLTGLFAADCGAFGIKATVTLPLIPEAEALAYGSFAFDELHGMAAAVSKIGRAGLASECFGFDPFLQSQRMKRESLSGDARALVGMMKSQGGFWKGLKEGARVVAAGRSFLGDATFSIHTIAEGRSQASADADMAAIRKIVAHHGGREVENTIPKVLRANPFPPVNSMLGPSGERWVPVHGIVSHSRAVDTVEAIIGLFGANEEKMEALGIGAGYMFVAAGTTGFLIEPVFFWPDAREALHEASVEPAHLARLQRFAPNPAARQLVEKLRKQIIDIFGNMGATHFQVGRTYPLKSLSDPTAWRLLEAIKAKVDPGSVMNPGVLGLP